MNSFLGLGALLLSALIFSSFGLWIRLLNQSLSVFQQIVFRNFLGMALAAVLIIATKKSLELGVLKKISKWNLFLYTFSVPVSVIFFNFSVLQTKLAVATFSFYLGSIALGLIFGATVFKETLNLTRKLSLILALAGLLSFLYPFSLEGFNWGFLWGLTAGLLDGLANVFRKSLGGKIEKMTLVLLTMLGGMFVSSLIPVFLGGNLFPAKNLSVNVWLVGLLFGFLLVAVNYLLLFGFQKFDLNLGSVVLASELFFSLIIGWLFFREIPTPNETVGGGLIALAVILPNLKLSRNPKS